MKSLPSYSIWQLAFGNSRKLPHSVLQGNRTNSYNGVGLGNYIRRILLNFSPILIIKDVCGELPQQCWITKFLGQEADLQEIFVDCRKAACDNIEGTITREIPAEVLQPSKKLAANGNDVFAKLCASDISDV
jgi:hypothetical protein